MLKETTLPSDVASEALAAVQRDWNAAALNWNVDGLAAVYTDDAVLFAGRPGIAIGQSQIRDYFVSYANDLKSTSMELVDQYLLQLSEDVVLAQGYVKFQFASLSGKQGGALMRTTLTLVKRQGAWKLIQHHFSMTPDAPPIPK